MVRFLCLGHTGSFVSFFTVSHKIVLSGPFVVLLEWTLISLMTDQDSIFTFEGAAAAEALFLLLLVLSFIFVKSDWNFVPNSKCFKCFQRSLCFGPSVVILSLNCKTISCLQPTIDQVHTILCNRKRNQITTLSF